MRNFWLFLGVFLFFISCDTKTIDEAKPHDFIEFLPGKFSSRIQAEKESGYIAICLVNTLIWKDRPGYWFYQELYGENNSAIYNQRIIHVKIKDSTNITSTNYVIPNQNKYANGWKNTSIFDDLKVENLKVREGCDVHFQKKTSTIYLGKTNQGTCASSFQKKIAYTTSSIVISKNKITSWDRGYDKNGKQVWGKIQGPYEFIRIQEDVFNP